MIAEVRRCCDCGMPIASRARFCPRCGMRQPRRRDVAPQWLFRTMEDPHDRSR